MGNNIENLGELNSFLDLGSRQLCLVSFRGFPQMPNLSNKVMVMISSYLDSRNVNINWEDAPYGLKNYTEYGLYGYYSTAYCKMSYDETSNTLTINDSNDRQIILTY